LRDYTYNGVKCRATTRRPSSRADKKYMRTVEYQGSTRLVHYGDPDMPMRRANDAARANFLSRHNCAAKRDPFAPGFWACLDWARTSEKGLTVTEADKAAYLPTIFSQQEVNYEPYMVRRNPVGQACANCRWFIPRDNVCYIVRAEPLAILPTGWCERWEALPDMSEDETQEAEVEAVIEAEAAFDPDDDFAFATRARAVLDNLMRIVRRPADDAPVSAFKALGNGLWMGVFSNNFMDREGEIISEAAWDKYLARLKAGFVPMPELWYAHREGTRHGVAQWVGRAGHMMLAVGAFDPTPAGRAMEQYYSRAKGLTMSHGFAYPRWARQTDGLPSTIKAVYTDLNVFEISTLPPGREANALTSFVTDQEIITMPLSETDREDIKRRFGPAAEGILALAERVESAGDKAREIGAAYKDFADLPAATAPAQDTVSAALMSAVLTSQADALAALMGLEGQLKAAVQQGATFEARLKALEALLEAPAASVTVKADTTAPSVADLLAAKRAEAEIAQKTTGHRPFEDVLPGLFKPK